jgi:septal ring-binding cell division protein DamX
LIAQRQDLERAQGAVEALRAEQERLSARTEAMEQGLQAFESRLGSLRSGVTAPADAAPALDGVLGPDWIAAQDPAHYTIQIVAAHNPQAIGRIARAYGYSADLAQYRRLRNERDWYALLHGSYPNLEAAKAALDRLPAEIRPFGPWVRRFGAVQRQLTRP